MTNTPDPEMSWDIKSPRELEPLAGQLLSSGAKILLLEGELGAGKTTLVKALCIALDSKDEVTSPTFGLVNEYRAGNGNPIYHIDLYRLNTIEEAIQIGVEEYLFSGTWCFIEWPELIGPLLANFKTLTISMVTLADGTRRIRTLK